MGLDRWTNSRQAGSATAGPEFIEGLWPKVVAPQKADGIQQSRYERWEYFLLRDVTSTRLLECCWCSLGNRAIDKEPFGLYPPQNGH